MDGLSASIWSSAVVLFFLMDPLGNVPIVLSVLKDIDPKRQRVIIARELVIALFILLVFLFLGKPLLNFLHLQQEAVTISGGIILLIIGLRMIFPTPDGIVGQQPDGEPFIVPLAIPLIAGPSVLAMLILMTQSGPNKMTDWLLSLLIAWGLSAVILLAAPHLLKLLRKRGLTALERLMGMILVMISIQMLLNGLNLLK